MIAVPVLVLRYTDSCMKKLTVPASGKFVVAVSGGVDSVVLLHLLQQTKLAVVVAHFDHGMRPDSAKDELFVRQLATSYQLPYVSERQELGSGASEAQARQARYDFLLRSQARHQADAIMTAHHADDVIETMMINLIRGSGWRGLCSLQSHLGLLRPLLSVHKAELIQLARQQQLSWREDSSNSDTHYLRNFIRANIMPSAQPKQWLALYRQQIQLAGQIYTQLENFQANRRHDFIMWPPPVSLEVLRSRFEVTRPQAKHLLQSIKTARTGSHHSIGSQTFTFTRDRFMVK